MRRNNKNKYILIVSLILLIGLGYAFLTANLKINGVSTIGSSQWDIRFTNVEILDKSDTVTADTPTIMGENDNNISYSVDLNSKGEFFEFSADIENKGTIDGTIEKITSTITEDDGEPSTTIPSYLNYSLTYLDNSPIEDNHPLLAGEKETIKVHIGLRDDLTDEEFNEILGKTITSNIEVDYVQNDQTDEDHYLIRYNTNGGSHISSKKVDKGSPVGELPTSTKQGYYLEGWYLENTYDTKVTSSYVPEDNIFLYAKWNKSVQSLNITNSLIELFIGENETINITNSNEIDETFTLSSSDEDIATVNENGVVTGIGKGTTTIIITGNESGQTVEVNVIVYKNETYTITFNPNGGTIDESTREIQAGNTLGELPTSILEGYYLDGWYTALTDGVKIDSNYRPMEDKEFFAIWKKSVESLDIVDDNLNIPLGDTFPIEFDNPDGIDENYTFESGDPNVATVDDDGNVTAIGEGETDITITGEDSGQEIIVHIIVTYAITFNANGGVANPNRKIVLEGNKLGALPETSKDESFLDGWYTGLTTGIPVDEEYEPHQDIELFARWNNAISAAEITNEEILLEPNGEEQINITNKDDIDETYVFASSDEGIATVDQEGNVTAVGEGETTITITGDESGDVVTINVVVRIPEATEFTVVFGANGGTGTMEPQTIQKDTPTKLTKNTFKKQYYKFNGWNTEADGSGTSYTDEQEVTNIGDTTLYAQWIDDPFPKVFEQEEYNFTGNNYIDTHISLYSSENIDKDYEIGFTIVQYDPDSNPSQATLFNTKNEASGYPGLVCRKYETNELEIASRKTSSANEVYRIGSTEVQNVKIYRIRGEIYYSINDADMVLLNDLTQYNPTFDLTAWFGAAPTNAAGTGAQRYFVGKMSNMYVKLGTYTEEDKYTVTLNPNGGTVTPTTKKVVQGEAVGALPIPTREGYYLDGWYTSLETSGIKINSSYVPESNIEVFAKWKKSVKSMIISPNEITITSPVSTETINITNANEIEEPYTFSSDDTSIVTVDQNGVITPVNEGTTTITITGTNSNETMTVYVTVKFKKYTVFFEENGGSEVLDKKVAEGLTIGTLPVTYLDHYFFDGWFTELTSGVEVSENTIVTRDMILYAHFTPAPDYTITFDANGGLVDEESRIVSGDMAVGELPVPTKTDYYFAGWLDESESIFYTANTIPTKNVTLTAQWNEEEKVARIGSVYYSTIQAAVDAAQENDEIVVLKDRAENLIVNKKVLINFDKHKLNGYITNSEGGYSTIVSGTIEYNVNYNSDYCAIKNNGTLIVGGENPKKSEELNIIATSSSTVYAINSAESGNVIINGGSITVSTTGSSSTSVGINGGNSITMNGGNINSSNYGIKEANNVTINGGTIVASTGAYVDSSGTITMNAGSISATNYGLIGGNSIIMNGGEIGGRDSTELSTGINTYNNMEMNGGIIKAKTGIYGSSNTVMNGGDIIASSSGISAGYGDNSITINDGNIKVINGISGTGVSGTNVTVNNGTIDVKATGDYASGYGIRGTTIIVNDGNIIVNSEGYTGETNGIKGTNITMNGGHLTTTADTYNNAIYGEKGSTITMNGGTIKATSGYRVEGIFTYGGTVNPYGTVIMNDAIVYTKGTQNGGIDSKTIIYPEGKRLYIGHSSDGYSVYYVASESSDITITLDPNNGSVYPTSIRRNSGDSVGTLPTPTRENYDFTGWYTSNNDGDKIDSNTIVSDNITYYAHWIEKPVYSITYDKNNSNATGLIENQYIHKGIVERLFENEFELEGYKFIGWNTKSDGTGESFANNEEISLISDITLYAQWIKTYVVSFDKNDSNAQGEQYSMTIISGIATLIDNESYNAYSLTNKKIESWNASPDNTGINYYPGQSITITQDTTLYAHWNNSYTLTFDKNNENATGTNYSIKVGSGSTTAIPNEAFNAYDLDDYMLDSYNTKNDYTGVSYNRLQDITITQDTTLYAHWSYLPISETIYWALQDNDNNSKNETLIISSNEVTGALSGSFSGDTVFTDYASVPWVEGSYSSSSNLSYNVTTVNIAGTVVPLSTAYWFYAVGYNASSFTANLNNLKTSKVTDMSYMFYYNGYKASSYNIDLSNLDTSHVTNMDSMFLSAGDDATTWNIGDLSNWDTSNVTNMRRMLQNAGGNESTWNIGDISKWDTSNVTNMNHMFHTYGYNIKNLELDLNNWDTSKVTNMSEMFGQIGVSATTVNINLKDWDTTNVNSIFWMFRGAGGSSSFTVDISGWDTSNMTDIKNVFGYAARNAKTWKVIIPQTNSNNIWNSSTKLYGKTTNDYTIPDGSRRFTLGLY